LLAIVMICRYRVVCGAVRNIPRHEEAYRKDNKVRMSIGAEYSQRFRSDSECLVGIRVFVSSENRGSAGDLKMEIRQPDTGIVLASCGQPLSEAGVGGRLRGARSAPFMGYVDCMFPPLRESKGMEMVLVLKNVLHEGDAAPINLHLTEERDSQCEGFLQYPQGKSAGHLRLTTLHEVTPWKGVQIALSRIAVNCGCPGALFACLYVVGTAMATCCLACALSFLFGGASFGRL
jgi:hypothetical protein